MKDTLTEATSSVALLTGQAGFITVSIGKLIYPELI